MRLREREGTATEELLTRCAQQTSRDVGRFLQDGPAHIQKVVEYVPWKYCSRDTVGASQFFGNTTSKGHPCLTFRPIKEGEVARHANRQLKEHAQGQRARRGPRPSPTRGLRQRPGHNEGAVLANEGKAQHS